MDCTRPIGELLVSGPCRALARGFGHLRSLEENARLLLQVMTKLRDMREDLKRQVDRAKAQRQKPLPRVLSWLDQVDALDEDATRIEPRLKDVGTNPIEACCSPFRLWSSYQLGKTVAEMLQSATELNSVGAGFRKVATACIRDPFADYDLECRSSICCGGAFSSALEELRHGLLSNDGESFIAVHGPRGVGKTTLLRQLYYELTEGETQTSWDFSSVILVAMSEDGASLLDVNTIQKQVMKQLGLSWRTDEDPESRAYKLREVFNRKFVVLLDGVSRPVDLDEMGIPNPGTTRNCMVVVASRDEEVCDKIGTSCVKVEMKPLAQADAWALFEGIVSKDVLSSHPEIPGLAKMISDGCGGLPLTLVTLGHHLASKTTVQEWQQAVDVLKDELANGHGVDEKLFTCLEFIYNNLPDEATRSCFLYCSLFPQGYSVYIKQLINYWMCEGFLGDCCDINDAWKKGSNIIHCLTSARLLQSDVLAKIEVTISGTNREFAFRMASKNGRNMKKYLLYCGRNEAPNAEDLTEAEKVSIVENAIHQWVPGREDSDPARVNCPNLVTFLTRSHKERIVVNEFLASMPSLLVLDLSSTSFRRFPSWVLDSVNLWYLSLSHSSLEELPKEIGAMVNLRVLDLSYTYSLRSIPAFAITRLLKLQVLHTFRSSYLQWNAKGHWQDFDDGGAQLCLQDMGALPQLGEVSLNLRGDDALLEFLNCGSLLGITRRVQLDYCSDQLIVHLLTMLRNLQEINLSCISNLTEWTVGADITQVVDGTKDNVISLEALDMNTLSGLITLRFACSTKFQSLRSIDLASCFELEHIAGLEELPCLEKLVLSGCPRLKVLLGNNIDVMVVGEEEEDKCVTNNIYFPSLKMLGLCYLSDIETISRHPLAFPCLETLKVFSCPQLRRLPLGPHSAMNIREIIGTRGWWHLLEWEDEATKMTFLSYFIDVDFDPFRNVDSDPFIIEKR